VATSDYGSEGRGFEFRRQSGELDGASRPPALWPCEFAPKELSKVVFLRSLTSADWPESRIASGDLAGDIDRLRREPGGVIVAHGGATFLDALIREGLIDEYRLVIHPVVAPSAKQHLIDLRRSRSGFAWWEWLTLGLTSATLD